MQCQMALQILLTACVLLSAAGEAAEPNGSHAAPWSRGTYGKLTFAPDAQSYTFEYGSDDVTHMTSTAGALENCTSLSSRTSTGTDPVLGAYDELTLTCGVVGELAVQYFAKLDAFLFVRRPQAADLPTVWPSMDVSAVKNGTKCLSWSDHYFFPGTVGPRIAHTNPKPADLRQCGGSGPLFFFGEPAPGSTTSAAMALSPLSHFTSNMIKGADHDFTGLGVDAAGGHCGGSSKCQMFATRSVLLARPGITRTTRAFGSLLRQAQNTTRHRGPAVTELSYWNDNQAGYSWWTVGHDQTVWGLPEDIYLTLKAGYDKAGIPIRGWEPDNNIDADFNGAWDSPSKNWIGHDYMKWNTTLYPSDGPAFVQKLGNLSMTYYTNGFGQDNVHAKKNGGPWNFVKKPSEPHPNVSYDFYKSIFGNANKQWNMEMLFTDFLCYRGPEMGQYQDCGDDVEGAHKWLSGMTRAAMDTGSEVQYCMALAHQILESSEFQGVTNARVSGDGGLDVASGTMPSLLASTVGLGWSKDNLRTADKCYVNATWANGTVKWPCGSINQREGTSGQFKMQKQQTILAALSLGPVGVADQLSQRPTLQGSRTPNPNAKITSNKGLIMGTCAATGDLLQPSYPLTPLDKMLNAFNNGNAPPFALWGSYTAVPAAANTMDASRNLWYTAYCFGGVKPDKEQTCTLQESDLAPMVDNVALPSGSFSTIPRGAFAGPGTTFANSSSISGHVVWTSDWEAQSKAMYPSIDTAEQATPSTACGAVSPKAWEGGDVVNVAMPISDTIVNVAPAFGGVALLGEAGKIAAVSTYRFASIMPGPSGKGVTAELRGKPGEVVPLMFALGPAATAAESNGEDVVAALKCTVVPTTIGQDGTALAHFSG